MTPKPGEVRCGRPFQLPDPGELRLAGHFPESVPAGRRMRATPSWLVIPCGLSTRRMPLFTPYRLTARADGALRRPTLVR